MAIVPPLEEVVLGRILLSPRGRITLVQLDQRVVDRCECDILETLDDAVFLAFFSFLFLYFFWPEREYVLLNLVEKRADLRFSNLRTFRR